MDKDKVVTAQDGEKYYPFDDNLVWTWRSGGSPPSNPPSDPSGSNFPSGPPNSDGKWVVVPMPEFLIYLDNGELVELMELAADDYDCICDSQDLFNFGCRC